jgi:hypothetical protein
MSISNNSFEIESTPFRGRNGRPRKHFKGRTPVQVFFEDGPTPEQVAELKQWFEELLRRQDAIRLTREARLDPVRIGLLKKSLAELAYLTLMTVLLKG